VGLMVEWYNHFLKGEPLSQWGPVRIYDPGTGLWTDRPTLWRPDREDYPLYLTGGQGATTCQPAGELVHTPVSEPAQIHYTYDPLNPIVNFGGPILDLPNGCLRQGSHCDRGDVITFESPPLENDLTVDGSIYLDLRVSSTAPDTAFVGRLSLVKEDGRAYFFRQGVNTLSHRDGDFSQAAYVPNEVVDIRIEMPPVLWTLHPGERLRLEIMSSNFPTVAQHPNVASDWFSVNAPLPADQTLHLDPDHPARLVLQTDPYTR
jgi:putative CocE/NonD family hydrolase